ncbi:MAG: IPT/TIG domain-containing protein [Pseudomonadota bacterium]
MLQRRLLPLLLGAALLAACGEPRGPWEPGDPATDTMAPADTVPEDTPAPPDDTAEDLPPDLPPETIDVAPDLPDPYAGWADLALEEIVPGFADFQGGDNVTLVGEGFYQDAIAVELDGVPVLGVIVITSQFANVVVPPHPPGLVEIRVVRIDGQEVILEDAFLYGADLSLFGVEPASGPAAGGTLVVLEAQGLEGGVQLLIGGRPAMNLEIIDPFTLAARTPPGDPGPRDVVLRLSDGESRLEGGFTYEGPPHPSSLTPTWGPEAGGALVTISGTGFSEHDDVWFGDLPAAQTTLLTPTLLRAETPPSDAGVVSVRVQGPYGEGVLNGGYAFVPAPAEPTGGPQLLAVVPGQGPAVGGNIATVLAVDYGDPAAASFHFGGVPATVLGFDDDDGAFSVEVPPGSPGTVTVALVAETGVAESPGAYTYMGGLAVFASAPATGSVDGGTTLTIQGQGFSGDVEVFVGPDPATAVTILSAEELLAVSPPGTPGLVDVTVSDGADEALLPGGFAYVTDQPELYGVDPPFAAQSGGALLSVYGAGFPDDAVVTLGGIPLLDPQLVSPSLVIGRVPPGDTGTVDVRLAWDGGEVILPSAFTYYDPKNNKGGTWGDPIDDVLNITVLDGSNGAGIPGAAVIVEKDDAPMKIGYTDERGQVTFSEFGLEGKHRVTAASPGYSLYSVIHFDATNVTVYLIPLVQGEFSGGSYEIVKQYIAGRVYGQDKYVVVPPGDCANKIVDGPQCAACEGDEDCAALAPDADVACTEIGDTGSFCTTACGAPEETCPVGYVCAGVGMDDFRCIPAPGNKSTRCWASKSSMFGYMSDPGPGFEANEHDIYFIESRAGEVAVVCYGGYTDFDTGAFTPVVMGLARNVVVLKNQVVQDVDVILSIPLGGSADIGFWDLPYHPEGIRKPYMILSLELGKDGYLSPPTDPVWDDDQLMYRLEHLPTAYTGPLFGTTWTAYTSINANTLMGMPYAVRIEVDVPTLFGDGLLKVVGENTWIHQGPQVRRIRALLEDDGGLLLAAEDGLWRFGVGWTPQPAPNASLGIHALRRDPVTGDIWAAGGEGTLWRQDGAGWHVKASGLEYLLHDVWAHGDTVAAVGALGSLVISTDGMATATASTWPTIPDLHGVWGPDPSTIYAVGEGGTVLRWSAGAWNEAWTLGSGTLYGIDGEGPDSVWVVGAMGGLYFYNGTDWVLLDTGDIKTLRAVRALGAGRALVAGEDGVLLRINDYVAVTPVDTGTHQDLLAVASVGADTLWAGGIASFDIGPFHPFPSIQQPHANSPFGWKEVVWDFQDGGSLEPTWHSLTFTTMEGFPFWQMMTDGVVRSIPLPPLTELLGVNLIPDGDKRFTLTAAHSPKFDIDNYRNNDTSIYDRASWAIDMVFFK